METQMQFKEAISLLEKRNPNENLSVQLNMGHGKKVSLESNVENLILMIKGLDDTGQLTNWSIN
jgi:hypothetical protein